MRRLGVIAAFVAALGLSSTANAAGIGLTTGEILLGQCGLAPCWQPTLGAPGTAEKNANSNQFEVTYTPANPPVTPPGPVVTSYWELDITDRGAANDVFSLLFLNSNANIWTYHIELVPTIGAPYSSAPLSLVAGTSGLLSMVVTGEIDKVRVAVSGPVPNGTPGVGVDYNADFNVAAVPEPGSMVLLGTGLIGLAGAVRRRIRK